MYLLGYRKALVARRTVVVNDESRPGIRRFYTEDPWGNRIELVGGEALRRAAESSGESTSRSGQCRPPTRS